MTEKKRSLESRATAVTYGSYCRPWTPVCEGGRVLLAPTSSLHGTGKNPGQRNCDKKSEESHEAKDLQQ